MGRKRAEPPSAGEAEEPSSKKCKAKAKNKPKCKEEPIDSPKAKSQTKKKKNSDEGPLSLPEGMKCADMSTFLVAKKKDEDGKPRPEVPEPRAFETLCAKFEPMQEEWKVLLRQKIESMSTTREVMNSLIEEAADRPWLKEFEASRPQSRYGAQMFGRNEVDDIFGFVAWIIERRIPEQPQETAECPPKLADLQESIVPADPGHTDALQAEAAARKNVEKAADQMQLPTTFAAADAVDVLTPPNSVAANHVPADGSADVLGASPQKCSKTLPEPDQAIPETAGQDKVSANECQEPSPCPKQDDNVNQEAQPPKKVLDYFWEKYTQEALEEFMADEEYSYEFELARARKHPRFADFESKCRADLADDAAVEGNNEEPPTWTWGDDSVSCGLDDLHDFIMWVRCHVEPKQEIVSMPPAAPSFQDALDYAVECQCMEAEAVQKAALDDIDQASLTRLISEASQHPQLPDFEADMGAAAGVDGWKLGGPDAEDPLGDLAEFIAWIIATNGLCLDHTAEPVGLEACTPPVSPNWDGRVAMDALERRVEKCLAMYPDPEDVMGSAAEVMAAMIQKHHSSQDDSDIYSNLRSLPNELLIGSACSGTGAFEDAMQHAVRVLNNAFDLKIKVENAFSCENIDWKQRFCSRTMGADTCLYEDVTLLGDHRRHCVAHKSPCPLPSLTGFSAGFSCTSYSNLNRDSKKNASAMQKSKDGNDDGNVASVCTFMGCLEILDQSEPDWALLENVESIDRDNDDSSDTNLQLCAEEIQKRNYAVECMLLDSEWYGLPQTRRRVYIICLSLKNSDLNVNASKFFSDMQKLLRSLYLTPCPAEKLFLHEKDEAVAAYLEHMQESANNRSEQEMTGAWTSLHMNVAEKRGIQWPIQVPKAISESPWYPPLTKRTQEVVAFAADEKYRLKKPVKVADCYHSANRYATGNLSLPVILPRTIAWSFQRQRPLLGRELLRCQGLSYESDFLDGFTESQLTQLAGNAFSGNIVLAVIMSLLCSIRYSSDSEKFEQEDITSAVTAMTQKLGKHEQ